MIALFDFDSLMQAAREAACQSYTPLTNRQGGVALLATNGQIYTGCTLEVSNYASSICAGKAALAQAVSDGAREFSAVATAGDHVDRDYLCGDCRQAYAEFGTDLLVISDVAPGETRRLCDLLPEFDCD